MDLYFEIAFGFILFCIAFMWHRKYNSPYKLDNERIDDLKELIWVIL